MTPNDQNISYVHDMPAISPPSSEYFGTALVYLCLKITVAK